jgi:cytochrome c oxidase subunit 2
VSGWFFVAEKGMFLPFQGSSVAPAVDSLFKFIFWVSAFFFLLIVGLMIAFVIRFRKRPGYRRPEQVPTHNTALELTWSVIPLILILIMGIWGFKVFLDINTPPANAYEVQVTGQKWKWLFTYANGYVDETLHVPVDEPVRLVMTSEDVIHSFFVPAFRIKRDVVPGRYTKLWFRATKPGTYQVFCTEYCGTGHSDMLTSVVVHEPGGFEKWLDQASNLLNTLPPAEAGRKLYQSRGCSQCHSVDGSGGIGPTFKGLFGHPVALKGGGTLTADENYLRESILEPMAKIVAGFEPVMPTYKGRLKDQEITAIISYLKTLAEGKQQEEEKGRQP